MKKTVLLLTILILGACGQTNNKQGIDQPLLPENTGMETEHPQNTRVNDEERADYLANLASDIPNVKNATAVVAGDYAIIGIDVDKDLDRSKVGTIKYSVAESIKHDPLGAGAIVVADPDINARLVEIKNDMAAGRPLQGIINELSDITGRIMPELPPQEKNINPQEAPQKPKKQMDKQDDRKLQEEQTEQKLE